MEQKNVPGRCESRLNFGWMSISIWMLYTACPHRYQQVLVYIWISLAIADTGNRCSLSLRKRWQYRTAHCCVLQKMVAWNRPFASCFGTVACPAFLLENLNTTFPRHNLSPLLLVSRLERRATFDEVATLHPSLTILTVAWGFQISLKEIVRITAITRAMFTDTQSESNLAFRILCAALNFDLRCPLSPVWPMCHLRVLCSSNRLGWLYVFKSEEWEAWSLKRRELIALLLAVGW